MSNFVDIPSAAEPVRSHEVMIVAIYCVLALAACFVLAAYADPANYAPVDPVATGFFP